MTSENPNPSRPELIEVRDLIHDLLERHQGVEVTGAGYYFVDRTADLTFTYQGQSYWLALSENSTPYPEL